MRKNTYQVTNGMIQLEDGLFSRLYKLEDKEFLPAPEDEQMDIYVAYEAFLNAFEPDIGLQVVIYNTGNKRTEKYINVTTSASSAEETAWKFTRLDLEVNAAIRRINGRKIKPLSEIEMQGVLTNIRQVSDCTFHLDYLQTENEYASCLVVEDLPDITNWNFLNAIDDSKYTRLISIHYRHLTPQEAVKVIRKKYLKNLSADQSETNKDRNCFINQELIATTLTILVFGTTRKDLSKNVDDVQNMCSRHMLSAKKLAFRQKAGLHTSLPVGMKCLRGQTVLESHTAAMFIPFAMPCLDHKITGSPPVASCS